MVPFALRVAACFLAVSALSSRERFLPFCGPGVVPFALRVAAFFLSISAHSSRERFEGFFAYPMGYFVPSCATEAASPRAAFSGGEYEAAEWKQD